MRSLPDDRRRPLRVAIVSLYPLDNAHMAGGMRVAVYNLVQALATLGNLDIHVVYSHEEVGQDHTQCADGVTVHYLALPRRRLLPRYLTSLQRIGGVLAAIKPDVVHAHTSHFAVPGLRAGLPTILTLHGASHREAAVYNRTIYDRLRFGLATMYDSYTLPRVRDIVAISPYIMREYEQRTRARWHRIDNPLPDAYFSLARCEQPDRLLYAGTITPLKDIMTLLRALDRVRADVPGVRLRLAGRVADTAYEQELRAFVAGRNLAGHVDFLGLLDQQGMLDEYAACTLVVLPSRQEVLPMTVIEGMAAGIPAVATRAGGLPDLVADGVTGRLVDVSDDEAMAIALSELLSDGALRRRMGAEARQIAATRFRASVVADRYRELYFQVAGRTL